MQLLAPRSNGYLADRLEPPAPLELPPLDPAEPAPRRLEAADYLMLIGVALLPFVSPMPGQFTPTPSDWTERVTICDAFFVLTMLAVGWRWTMEIIQGWFPLRRPTYRFSQLGRTASTVIPGRLSKSWPLPPLSSLWYIGFALLLVMALSWFANPYRPITMHMALALLIQIYLFCVGLMVASAVSRYGTVKPILVAWIVGFCLLSIPCLYDTLAILTGRQMIYPAVLQRLRGPFRTSAQLAQYCLTSCFILVAAASLMRERRWLRRISLGQAVAAVLFVILASRRSAFASLVAGFIALMAVSKQRAKILLNVTLPIVGAIVLLVLLAPPDLREYFSRRIEPLIGEDPQRVQVAVDHFQRGVAAFKEHPVLGVGFGAFEDTRFGDFSDESNNVIHEQHSGYIAILAETGAVGFSTMIALHLAVLFTLIKVWKNMPFPYSEFAATLIVLFVALGVSEVYNRIWRERSLWVVLGIVAALLTIASRNRFRTASGELQWHRP